MASTKLAITSVVAKLLPDVGVELDDLSIGPRSSSVRTASESVSKQPEPRTEPLTPQLEPNLNLNRTAGSVRFGPGSDALTDRTPASLVLPSDEEDDSRAFPSAAGGSTGVEFQGPVHVTGRIGQPDRSRDWTAVAGCLSF
ncbi:hypothetical protein SISNIDRAFT_542823 [Sistotremastrum niveocremeum HHB9708]|uniref:Uncharacterized protein n=1 Tax=Sistotremastrum niveocremeum HHB9708 TaxID=1314777 RepID=A0A164MDY6_9AGAM|nr:hypothetical protein SISNIDRAFT_542823 [Sistotremastrum niveocremeum HHB9708]